MNKRDYMREVSALCAPADLRKKIAALPTGGRRRAHNVRPYGRWTAIAAALVLVIGLGAATPALLRAFAPEGGEITPPPIVTEAPAISDEELTELLAAQIPDPRSDVEPELLYSARRGGRTLGVLRYYAETPEGGAMSLILGLFDNRTKTIADDFINVIPGTDGEVCVWGGEDGPLYLLWTNYTVPAEIEKHVAGLYAMYDDGSVLAAELPSDILDQPDVPGEAASMFQGEGPSVFWDDHVASIVPTGLELYVRTPGWSDGSQDMPQWTYLGLIPLPLTFSSPYSNLPPQEIQGVAIDALDYGALEGQMSAGEWAALEGYLPVLRDGQTFRWVQEDVDDKTAVKKPRPEELTLEEFYRQLFGLSLPDGKLDLERLTLFGFSGDGTQDLILCFFNGGGNYLILHREGEEFYGTDMGYRSFEQLQTDGVFMGSAGAWYNFYYRLQFRDGRFEKELLGYQNNGTYEIGGIAVSEDYFVNWRENLMASDMWWYYPTAKGNAISDVELTDLLAAEFPEEETQEDTWELVGSAGTTGGRTMGVLQYEWSNGTYLGGDYSSLLLGVYDNATQALTGPVVRVKGHSTYAYHYTLPSANGPQNYVLCISTWHGQGMAENYNAALYLFDGQTLRQVTSSPGAELPAGMEDMFDPEKSQAFWGEMSRKIVLAHGGFELFHRNGAYTTGRPNDSAYWVYDCYVPLGYRPPDIAVMETARAYFVDYYKDDPGGSSNYSIDSCELMLGFGASPWPGYKDYSADTAAYRVVLRPPDWSDEEGLERYFVFDGDMNLAEVLDAEGGRA